MCSSDLDRIREQLKARPVSERAPALRLDFSAGLTTFNPEELLTQAMDRADRALYLAKAHGRGRTEVLETARAMPGATAGDTPGRRDTVHAPLRAV